VTVLDDQYSRRTCGEIEPVYFPKEVYPPIAEDLTTRYILLGFPSRPTFSSLFAINKKVFQFLAYSIYFFPGVSSN